MYRVRKRMTHEKPLGSWKQKAEQFLPVTNLQENRVSAKQDYSILKAPNHQAGVGETL